MLCWNIACLPEDLQTGLREIARYGFIVCASDGITLHAERGGGIRIEKAADGVHIVYDTLPHFYMAFARCMGLTRDACDITPTVKHFGIMLDCSRNAVPTAETIKSLICLYVLTGYTYMELYTEDTYTLPGEPYFGHARGRYTEKELREIAAFARIFDFTIIPCIQTLSHLSHLAKWTVYTPYMEDGSTLLVGDEHTYALIRKSIRFFKEVFGATRVNIGTDEAGGLGRGKYLDRNGYRTKEEIYLEHLQKVFAVCREEGVEPEFWADAFYLYGQTWDDDAVKALFDGTQVPIMWEYTCETPSWYAEKLKTLETYAGRTMYAGGYRKWIGFVPENRRTDASFDAAFEAVRECGIDNILMTAWGDDGAECSAVSIVSSMWHSASRVYPCACDADTVLATLTGYTFAEWRDCEELNHLTPGEEKLSNAGKWLLYNDFLIGLWDHHVKDGVSDYYRSLLPKYEALAARKSRYSYVFATYAALCRVLSVKAEYGKKLHKAYHAGDKKTVRAMCDELPAVREALRRLLNAAREQWIKENKGTGFEVLDVRLGGLAARTETVSQTLTRYLEGSLSVIDELEEDRLPCLSWANYRYDGESAVVNGLWCNMYTVNPV